MAVMGLSPAARVDAGGTEGLTLGVQVLQSTSLGAAAPESTWQQRDRARESPCILWGCSFSLSFHSPAFLELL